MMRFSFFFADRVSPGARRLVRSEVRVHLRFPRKIQLVRASRAALFALDAGQFLRPQVQSDGGSENGFGRPLLRSPRGLRLCAKSDRIS